MTNDDIKKISKDSDPDAQFELGFKNYMGVEIIHGKRAYVDHETAFNCFKIAAEKEHPKALYYLARMFEKGEHVNADPNESLKYYQKSSKAGFGPASAFLGLQFDSGKQVKRDVEKAFQYFELAIQQGEESANYFKGKYLLNGELKGGKQTKDGIRCLEISAQQGYVPAQFDLGMLYMDGVDALQNYEKGIYWLTEAAKKDNQKAQNKLAHCYYYGIGVDVNMNGAYGWWRRAAEPLNGALPSAEALMNCGICNMNGKGAEKDVSRAENYLLKASRLGLPHAQFCLGILYKDHDVKIQAHAWLNIAATGKHENAIKERKQLEKNMTPLEVREAQQIAEKIANQEINGITAVSTENIRSNGKDVVENLKKLGFFVQDQELLESLGGNPNALSDEEFEAVFGESRD